MLINFLGLLVLLVFGYIGYRRGAMRMVTMLAALAVAGLLAKPTAGLGTAMVGGSVPLTLAPMVGTLVMGFLWFALLSLPLEHKFGKRQKQREEEGLPRVEQWDALVGVMFGLVWGLLLFALCLGGVASAGRATRAMRRAQAEVSYRSTHPGPWLEVDDAQLKLQPAEGVERWTAMVEDSAFSPVVEKVAPISAKTEKTLTDMNVVVNDPQLLRAFQRHASVQTFVSNPKVQELAADPEITQLAAAGDYSGLLNHPKVAALAKDESLVRLVKGLDFEKLVQDVRESTRSNP